MADRAYLERLTRELTDKGALIEAGWVGFRLAVVTPSAGAVQLQEMRLAFFAGAQHLFASIMSILDPGEEPTDADMARMDSIKVELDKFLAEIMSGKYAAEFEKHMPTKGSA